MRISIRRCLSMLRNTSDGNELAVPLQCLVKKHSMVVGILYALLKKGLVTISGNEDR